MDRGAWQATVHGVAQSQTRLTTLNSSSSDIYWGFPGGLAEKNPFANARDLGLSPGWEDPLEREMATHSSILDWEMPWTEEPGGLQSMGSQKSRT